MSKFQQHFPEWRLTRDVRKILEEIYVAKAAIEAQAITT